LVFLGCGFTAVATLRVQVLSSPNYPNNYDNNQNCTWSISTEPGNVIEIDFINFDIEDKYDVLVGCRLNVTFLGVH